MKSTRTAPVLQGRRAAGSAVAALALFLSTASVVTARPAPGASPSTTNLGTTTTTGTTTASTDGHDGSRLEGVIILSRHGNRSLLKNNATIDAETSNTWPVWNVPPGHLTPRGREQMVGMGGYYRERFQKEGLLTGNDAEDVKHAWFHTNVIQRTIQTGCALAEGMFPSTTTTVHHLGEKEQDPIFYGAPIEKEFKDAAIRGRIGNNIPALAESMNPQFDLIEKSLGKPGLFGRTLSSISLAAGIADSYMCEYCEGLPMDQVAFGRATREELREMLKMLALDFDLQARTADLARLRMSNLVSHMTATFQQMATGKKVEGAFGDADDKVFVIVGHDTTLSSVGGLLRLDWVLPDTGRTIIPPGGALVFELRRRGGAGNGSGSGSGSGESGGNGSGRGEHFVRVYMASRTLEQQHTNARLSLETPPAIAPIFVPGASRPGAWYDAPLKDFVKLTTRAIDPELVYPVKDGGEKVEKDPAATEMGGRAPAPAMR